MEIRPLGPVWPAIFVAGSVFCLAPEATASEPSAVVPTPAVGATADVTPITLDVAGHVGLGYRADDPPSFSMVDRAGLTFGLDVLGALLPGVAAGLGYEHLDLGSERSGVGPAGAVDLERDVSTLWALLRAYPLDLGSTAFFLNLGVGLAWQSADAVGVAFTDLSRSGGGAFTCSGAGSASLALKAGVGAEAKLGEHVLLYGDGGVESYGLTSDSLDGCVPGAGTAAVLGLRMGVAYRFDVSRFVR